MDNKKAALKSAWLVQWGCHDHNENEYLEQAGIKNKIIDIISTRKDFDKIIEIAEDIYKQKMFSFSEKIYLANYSKSEQRKKEIFGKSVPLFTSYQTDIYRNLIESIDKNGLDSKNAKEWQDKWMKYPQFVIVGYNPYLEIRKVFNLIAQENNGRETIEWDYPLTDGSFKKEKYQY